MEAYEMNEALYFHTENSEEYETLLARAKDGNALFCFLSNVVFRKNDWVRHGNMFADRMNTIFIQIYMNLQTLKEEAVYAYIPNAFVKNHGDAQVNDTFKREYDVLAGLNGVVDFNRKQVDEILNEADVLVSPSRQDSMPTVAAEAMMHSVP